MSKRKRKVCMSDGKCESTSSKHFEKYGKTKKTQLLKIFKNIQFKNQKKKKKKKKPKPQPQLLFFHNLIKK